MAQPEYQPPPMPAVQPEQCPMGCKRNCFTYCPRDCCGVAGKRDKVLNFRKNEKTADQMESEGSGNESVAEEETEQRQVEDNDEPQSTKSSENADKSQKPVEQTETDAIQEGSSENQHDEAEFDD